MTGSITRVGDEMARTALYEAANALLLRVQRFSALKRWAMEVAKRRGIVFVDPYVARGDHTGCAPASQRWTAGHIPEDGFQYHPTALGHQVMAKMIAKALSQR